MEFQELLIEEIMEIIALNKKKNEDEKFLRQDLNKLLDQRLQEYDEALEEEYSNMDNSDDIDAAYKEGYDDGFNDAREEIQELAREMRKPR
jgi:flagellar biosynthesis/type III secretory pathway protein FliH